MHPPEVRTRARQQYLAGMTVAQVARHNKLPYATVWHWCNDRPEPARSGTGLRCFRCLPDLPGPTDPAAYAYLLGLYLGDGHLVTSARTPVLRIYCTNDWPALIDACAAAMLTVLAGSVQRIRKKGCVGVQSYGVHWPCLLPQHGPGRKHERPIALVEWQEEIVAARPGHFLRGLFHSDGCRVVNRIRRQDRVYTYPRYMFVNESADIMRLCQEALDLLGVAWRMNRPNSLSVARRAAVAELDRHVGPKS